MPPERPVRHRRQASLSTTLGQVRLDDEDDLGLETFPRISRSRAWTPNAFPPVPAPIVLPRVQFINAGVDEARFIPYSPTNSVTGAGPTASLSPYVPPVRLAPSTYEGQSIQASLLALETHSQQSRMARLTKDRKNVTTGKSYASHVARYQRFWERHQEVMVANNSTWTIVPAFCWDLESAPPLE
ncbi:hypothetical protein EIP91_011338, partial [Steccherinum ochraceum]